MTINVFQRNWAFTSRDAEKPVIRTGSFGPCCVVSFASQQYAALVHIDTATHFDSIGDIFKKFAENGVPQNDVKVVVLGGWKDCEISAMACAIVVLKIRKNGFTNVSTKNMFSKTTAALNYRGSGIGEDPHYHYGAQIDARTGTTYILKKRQAELDLIQHSLTAHQLKQEKKTELPITQVH